MIILIYWHFYLFYQ